MLTGLQHIGVTVNDLDLSIAWYKHVLGLEPEYFGTNRGDTLSKTLEVKDADIRFAFFALGNTYLELLEFRNVKKGPSSINNSDTGAAHICFETDDIDAEYQALLSKNVACSSAPVPIETGDLSGARFVYFRDPDGVQLEFLELPARLRRSPLRGR